MDYKDIRTRFQVALNEKFSDALKRLTDLKPQIETMDDVNQRKVTDEVHSAADYVERFGPISQIENYFVGEKGFSNGDFKRIETILKKESQDSLKAIVEYIKNPKPVSYFTGFNGIINVVDFVSKDTGISKTFLKELFSMDGQMKSGKGVGRGELFLGFMIEGATNASVGDVNANGVPYEVKAKQARLNTQNGFGNGIAALSSFFKELTKINKELADKYTPKSKTDFASYNFKKGTPSRFYNLLQDAHQMGIDLTKIYELQANTMYCSPSGIWSNGDKKIKSLIVKNLKDNVNKDGTPKNDQLLNYTFMWINMRYYQTQEFFEGIFLIHPDKGTLAYFNPQVSQSKATSWLSKNTKYVQPSWQDNPTSNSWKIELK